MLVVEDRVVTDQEDKYQIRLEHFEGVLGQARTRTASLDLAAFRRAGMDLSILDAPFSEDEVWATIKGLPDDRAPGPYGFTGRFYKSY